MNNEELEIFIEHVLKEDIGDGDHTSMACIPDATEGTARLIVKESGIIAGIAIVEKIFKQFDRSLNVEIFINDGEKVKYGDIAFHVSGKTISILQTERLVLNIMQRMSGIATHTHLHVKKLNGLKTKILDTRKTTPGIRFLEKEAVKIGGGTNHRMGLYDMIMIKDNHIDFSGGIANALKNVDDYLIRTGKNLKIVIEARNFEEIDEIMRIGGADRIMLDNFSVEDTKRAVQMINGKFETESSGGINIDTIRNYAECGVDYISVGALTHQIKSLDMSLKAI